MAHSRSRRVIAASIIVIALSSAPASARLVPLAPEPYQCPGSNAHVWNEDQCPRIGDGGAFNLSPGGGGSSGGGLLDTIRDILSGGSGLPGPL